METLAAVDVVLVSVLLLTASAAYFAFCNVRSHALIQNRGFWSVSFNILGMVVYGSAGLLSAAEGDHPCASTEFPSNIGAVFASIFLMDRCVSLIIKYELSINSNSYALAKEENPYGVIEVPWLLRYRSYFRQDVFSPVKLQPMVVYGSAGLLSAAEGDHPCASTEFPSNIGAVFASIFLMDRCVSLIIKYELSINSNSYALAKEENPYGVIEVPWLLRYRSYFRQDVFSPVKLLFAVIACIVVIIEVAVTFANWDLAVSQSFTSQCALFAQRIQYVTAGVAFFCIPVLVMCSRKLMRVKENFSIVDEMKQYIGCWCLGFLISAVCWSVPNLDRKYVNIVLQFFIPFVMVNVAFVRVVMLVRRESSGGSNHEVPTVNLSRSPSSEDADIGNKSAAQTEVKLGKIQKLAEVMDDPDLLPMFEQFMIQEFAVENVYFLKAVKKFKSQASHQELSNEQLMQSAQSVFDRFCDGNSKLAVNISAEHHSWIKVHLADSQVVSNLFDGAEQEIMELVAHDSLRRFLRSEEFKSKKATVAVSAVSVPTFSPSV
eukprot:TRINITY_DN4204_c0_g1_i1.p1 TRINITY_DN4204_c0_g1~~TRINITY_DN4204_c0_g1_i1.p1  ORF type:complete len:546 (+),score=135.32 TRINITY_DN4204_c0_g1_i1:1177-2814(+)